MKFNEFAKTFPHEIFGELTVIKNNKEEDTYWFVGKEIQQILGFAKLEQAIRYADLDDDEVLILEKKNNTKLFKSFIKHYDNKGDLLNKQPSTTPILSKYSNSITLVKESGLYGLAMTFRKPIAKYFRRAIRKDILPGVRKLFEKVKEIELKTDVILHLDNEYQKLNSKMINAINMQNGGVIKTVSYNIKSCKDHYNNKTPK